MKASDRACGFAAALILACGLMLLQPRPAQAQMGVVKGCMMSYGCIGPAPASIAVLRAQREAEEKQLEKVAIIDRRVMIRMQDGKYMMADVYRPKTTGKVPTIFIRTPYLFNYWDVKDGTYADMTQQLRAVENGYAYVEINERGQFFSQGKYDILGPPLSDAVDEVHWITSQPWSNGKSGTNGCSSTAEWQSAAVAQPDDPGWTTFNVQGFGAGVGRVGPYFEQGNWYRGGAVQMLFIDWLYGEQNEVRPMFPPDTSQSTLTLESKMFDLAPQMPPVDWNTGLWYLPEQDIIRHAGGPPGIFASHVDGIATGGDMIARTPNSPAWYKGGLWNDGMRITKPGLWFMSWFDVSVSPNLAEYNFVRRTAPAPVNNQQYAIIAPVLHCQYAFATPHTMIGNLDVGDARYDYEDLVYHWFDHFMKGEHNGVLSRPKVMYYLMGKNEWKTSPTWPPPGVTTKTYYFSSGGHANTLRGDGMLSPTPEANDHPDRFLYDPAHPVTTFGGGGCCEGNAVKFGSYDQDEHEMRNDVLVYNSPIFTQGTEVSGPITVTLYVSSSAKDTDFTFKVMDVYPDGQAFNITENIQRMRYRDGYTHAPVWMQAGQVYKVTFQPIDTSYYFKPGHRLRIALSSSNFPRFDRNLNTGGNNYDESHGVIAHNAVHHDTEFPSSVTLTVLPASAVRPTFHFHPHGEQ
ncbi:MAG: CocE/NonD family hydrolase [Terriglobales bacterium]